MTNILNMSDDELTKVLTYSGLILIAFELIKSLIIKPIKLIYANTTFGEGMPFKSYEEDVLSRHKNEFEACLYYLRDFMKVIKSEDLITIQALRKHRNDLAHDLSTKLNNINVDNYIPLLEGTIKVLFKLSNHNTIVEIGADPKFNNKGIDLSTIAGEEYFLLIEVLNKIKIFKNNII